MQLVGVGSFRTKMASGNGRVGIAFDGNQFACYLVISADTAIAHLAGSLGRPVWLPLAVGCDWRWLMQRTDSPWYPTMRIFRQPARDDWPSVMQKVCSVLSENLAKGEQI